MKELLVTIIGGVVYTELVGYGVHILLHSEKIPSLSRSHMLHHLRDYGVGKPMHRKTYFSSASDRANLLGVGWEWMAPILIIVGVTLSFLNLLGLTALEQLVFTLTGVFWGYFLFGYMHSAMHIENFWMLKVPLLKSWYLNARKLHDFHHLQISKDGRMQKNYGICFFWFDRIFGSFSPRAKKFDQQAYSVSLQRYKDILNS